MTATLKQRLADPFRYIAGGSALLLGGVLMLATAGIAWLSHTHFDGVLDVHTGKPSPLAVYFLEPLIDWLCATIVFYGCCLPATASRVRLIDIAGTAALARGPLLLASLIALLQPAKVDLMKPGPLFLLVAVGVLALVVWAAVLLYQGMRISANLKGNRTALVFAGGLFGAEVLSKTLLHFIYPYFS